MTWNYRIFIRGQEESPNITCQIEVTLSTLFDTIQIFPNRDLKTNQYLKTNYSTVKKICLPPFLQNSL